MSMRKGSELSRASSKATHRKPGPCRVCGSTDCTSLGPPARRSPTFVAGVPIDIEDLNQQFMHCNACDYAFIDPCIPEERLLECYRRSPGHNWTTDGTVAHARFYERKRDTFLRYLGGGKRILDFGCYDGGFLDYLGDGFDRWGIEPAATAADRARQRGIKILSPSIEAVDPSAVQPFDGMISFDVLEHLTDPVPILKGLQRLLKPGGILLVETGNYDAPAFRRLGPLYHYGAIVEHVGFFDERSLREAGQRAGLKLVEFTQSIHSRWPMNRTKARLVNAAYWTLRALRRVHVPLPAAARNIAAGALPRTLDLEDHFMAVLQRPSVD